MVNENAARLRAAFEQSPVSTVIYDVAGRPIAANRSFEQLWGASIADVPPDYSIFGDPQLEAAKFLVQSDDKDKAVPTAADALAGARDFSCPARRRSGRAAACRGGLAVARAACRRAALGGVSWKVTRAALPSSCSSSASRMCSVPT